MAIPNREHLTVLILGVIKDVISLELLKFHLPIPIVREERFPKMNYDVYVYMFPIVNKCICQKDVLCCSVDPAGYHHLHP